MRLCALRPRQKHGVLFVKGTTPIVALTGWGSLADRAKAMRAGIDHHLLKPLQLAALLAIFDSLPPPLRRK